MFRKGLIMAALAAAFLPAFAKADFEQGDLELTLGGNALGGRDFDGFAGGVNFSIGTFLTDELELGVRQSITYTDVGTAPDAGGQLSGSTRVFADFHFDVGAFQPYVGGNIGYVYGDAADTWQAAPEAGVKYFLNSTTFVFAAAEYQFFFDEGDDADDSFSEGQFVYSLGIGVKF